MQLHPKQRIEIILEAPALKRLTKHLDDLKVSGYTVMPAIAGRGNGKSWTREGLVTEAGKMVVVVCIVDKQFTDQILETIFGLVSNQVGILSVSSVEVVRAEKF